MKKYWPTYDGPSSCRLNFASHWPILTHSSSDLPSTMPAQKPPANASLTRVLAQLMKIPSLLVVDSPGAVGVDNLLTLDRKHGNLLDLCLPTVFRRRNDGRLCPLRDDDDTRPRGVFLRRLGQQLRHLDHGPCGVSLGFGPDIDLVFVGEEVVAVRQDGGELVFEELRDEPRREAEHEDLQSAILRIGQFLCKKLGLGKILWRPAWPLSSVL